MKILDPRFVDEVDFVEDQNFFLVSSDIVKDIVNYGNALLNVGVGGVDHVKEEVAFDAVFEGGREGFDQFRGEIADEADGVVEEDFFPGAHHGVGHEKHVSHVGTEGREEFVFSEDAFFCQAVE